MTKVTLNTLTPADRGILAAAFDAAIRAHWTDDGVCNAVAATARSAGLCGDTEAWDLAFDFCLAHCPQRTGSKRPKATREAKQIIRRYLADAAAAGYTMRVGDDGVLYPFTRHVPTAVRQVCEIGSAVVYLEGPTGISTLGFTLGDGPGGVTVERDDRLATALTGADVFAASLR